MRRYIIYYRVSTKKQEVSGLGIEAQHVIANEYVLRNPGTILAEYTETETGKCTKRRPELEKAIAHARSSGAILIIAKLDRLARNVAFISTLMESGLEFVACDLPAATKFTIHIFAALAEEEARMIAQRTKDALRAKKARGVKLGSQREGHWDGMTKDGKYSRADRRLEGSIRGRQAAQAAVAQRVAKAYQYVLPQIREMRACGKTYQQIVDTLNAQGHRTRHKKPWTPQQLKCVIKKFLGVEYTGSVMSVLNPCSIAMSLSPTAV